MQRMTATTRFVAVMAALCAGLASATTTAHAQTTFPLPTDSAQRMLIMRLSALAADSMEGRRAGSVGSRRARAWIEHELAAVGALPVGASYAYPVKLAPRGGSTDTIGANIVARIPGRTPGGKTIVISAHYDHLGMRNGQIYNGADDDASGCVALLTIAERLRKAPLEHDVLLVFFDGEEMGMPGSKSFIAAPPIPIERIAFDLSLDMVARQDGKALWVSGTSHYPELKPLAERAVIANGVPIRFGHDTKSLKPDDDWTNSSDHAVFHAKRIPFLYLGVEDHPDYHKPGDHADRVDPAFYMGAVDYAYRVLRAVDAWSGLSNARATPE